MTEEQDSHGIPQHAPGSKLDAGKPLAAILLDFGLALRAVADVGTAKGSRDVSHAWFEAEGEHRHLDLMLDHLLERDEIDRETGCYNIAVAAWGMLCALESKLLDAEGELPSTWAVQGSGPRRTSALLEFPRALAAVVATGTFGAVKYSRGGWSEAPNGQIRYLDAAVRHLLYRGHGIDIDADSKCLHDSQVIWNLLASLELKLREKRAAYREVSPGAQAVLTAMAAAKPVDLRPAVQAGSGAAKVEIVIPSKSEARGHKSTKKPKKSKRS